MSVHPGSIWIDANWTELPTEVWIAATGDGIVGQDADLVRLYVILRERLTGLEDVAVAYLPEGIRQ